jgi:ferredoxin
VPVVAAEGGLVTTRLHIDWTRCDGHGSCAELLPELLGVDDFGFPVPRGSERDPRVVRRDEDAARHAVRNCPVMALRLYDAAG